MVGDKKPGSEFIFEHLFCIVDSWLQHTLYIHRLVKLLGDICCVQMLRIVDGMGFCWVRLRFGLVARDKVFGPML